MHITLEVNIYKIYLGMISKITICLISLILLSSCTLVSGDSKRRKFQTKIHRLIKQKTPDYAKCAKKHQLFKKLARKRINVVLKISIDAKGEVSKFNLDNKPYPGTFINCFFNATQLISFPKNPEKIEFEVTQPFNFSQRQSNP